jgi:ABC-2 type transport system permease protein
MSAPAALASDVSIKRPRSLGGVNTTVLGLEIRRLLRNRRTVIFALIIPAVFFLLFGLNKAYAHQSAGPGSHGNVSAMSRHSS